MRLSDHDFDGDRSTAKFIRKIRLIAQGLRYTCSSLLRDVAQLGSAPALGAGCRRFKSCHPDWFQSLAIGLSPKPALKPKHN